MVEFPRGTVTFLFTDVDRSTELVKRLQEQYGAVLAQHRDLLRASFAEHGGIEVDTQGDAFFIAFDHAREAVEAAVAAQRALADHRWPADAPLAVRMGLHTGEPYPAEHGYTGVAVHRAARICTIAHGGQVLLSRSTAGIVDDNGRTRRGRGSGLGRRGFRKRETSCPCRSCRSASSRSARMAARAKTGDQRGAAFCRSRGRLGRPGGDPLR